MSVLIPMQITRCFPACRDGGFRALYIDDSILASVIHLDNNCERDVMMFNPTKHRLCSPFCSLTDVDPLPVVSK